ncbi:MAG: TSUP family transporter [Bdellovibrionales bacterium]|nr:TSUP family transporter [Bdellovibrionales bacterium]
MEFIIIPLTAFAASLLTFFSGFGLGTILLPVFAIWFSLDISIALTAVVHFLNNIFKLILVGKHANKAVILKFGLPAMIAAFIGAAIIVAVTHLEPLAQYEFFGHIRQVTPVKLMIALLMIFFTLFEIIPKFKNIQFDPKYLSVGGILSGFFGGLSGHQGALRSAFLVRAGLTKEGFIATGVVIACLIDLTRLSVYASHFTQDGFSNGATITIAATLAAFAGAYIGSKVLKKITMNTVQQFVSVGLFLLAIGIAMGLI